MSRLIPTRELAAGLACVLLVGAFGAALAVQGWRSRVPGGDVIPYIDGAHLLLSQRQIPEHGVITSLASYAPPGLAWVVVPGVLVFSDSRVFDAPGMVLLHLGTLIGIFLLARLCFGTRCALISVLLYGVSEIGITFAGSLELAGPRGHPFFYVWMTYWVCLWVVRRDARYLAAACLTWVAGMYVFMEIAPALLVMPAIWMLYRPPVRLRPLALVVAIGLVMWFPYLRFESTRGFADLRSQILVESIAPDGYAASLCDSTLTLRRWAEAPVHASSLGEGSATGITRLAIWSGGHVLAAARGLVGNFGGVVPGINLALFALTVVGLLIVGLRAARTPVRFSAPWSTLLAIGLLTWAILVNHHVVSDILGPRLLLGPFAINSIAGLQRLTALAGVALLARRPIVSRLETVAARLDQESSAPQVLAVALAVPWIVLLLIVAPGREDRFMALWPLQAIVLAFVAVMLPAACGRGARLASWLVPVVIVMLLVINPLTMPRVEAWRRDGWSGSDAVEIRIADYLAARLHAEGKTQAMIGYRLFTDGPPAPPWRPIDTRWKMGGEFDAALEYPHGMTNLNHCPEGLSTADEYRIVEVSPPSAAVGNYFDVPLQGRARLLDRIGQYDVYKRE